MNLAHRGIGESAADLVGREHRGAPVRARGLLDADVDGRGVGGKIPEAHPRLVLWRPVVPAAATVIVSAAQPCHHGQDRSHCHHEPLHRAASLGAPRAAPWMGTGPAIDICVKQSSSTNWGSPVLAANQISGGLTYPAMSKVIYIDPGASLDFRAVAPGGTCDTPVGIDLTAQTINAHGTYTITAVGLLAAGAPKPYR